MTYQLESLRQTDRVAITAALNRDEKERFCKAISQKNMTVNAFLRSVIASTLAEAGEIGQQKTLQMLRN